jgi:hypothetical protein
MEKRKEEQKCFSSARKMEKIVTMLQQVRNRALQVGARPAVTGPLSKAVAFREWWPVAFAIAICWMLNSNLGAAVLAAQAWSLGKSRVFEPFLRAALYLALSLIVGPQLAMVFLILDFQASQPEGNVATPPVTDVWSLGLSVSLFRGLGVEKVTQFVDQLAESAKPE